MASSALQICPHTCGCSPEPLTTTSRTPIWLAGCPIYEPTDAGMKHHLARDIHHHSCQESCPVYNNKSNPIHGRDLTPQEFAAWVPYIGDLPQFRAHIPTQYHHLIASDAPDVSSLPKHPLFPPSDTPPPVSVRYDDFFASLSNKPAKPRETRVALGSLPQDVASKPNRTYDEFFTSYLGLRTSPSEPSTLRVSPDGSSAPADLTASARELTDREKRLKDIQDALSSNRISPPAFNPSNTSNGEQERARAEREKRLKEIQDALKNKTFPTVSPSLAVPYETDGSQRDGEITDVAQTKPKTTFKSFFDIPTQSTVRPNTESGSEAAAAPAISNANYHVLRFNKPIPIPQTYDAFFGTTPSTSAADPSASANSSTSPVPAPAPMPPVSAAPRPRTRNPKARPPLPPAPPPPRMPTPPPPPPRDLATLSRILDAASAATLRATLLSVYSAVPAAQPALWERLATTASTAGEAEDEGGARALRTVYVARTQTCRHCAEEFDIVAAARGGGAAQPCCWHYGTALFDPALAHAWPPPGMGNPDPGMYFWDCCGARLSAQVPGCIRTAHAPLAPPSGAPMRILPTAGGDTALTGADAGTGTGMRVGTGSKKRKRARGPTMRCAHCASAYRENDGGRCLWHDGVLVGSGVPGQPRRWVCCGQDESGNAVGCVESEHVPPRVTRPK